MKSSLRVLPLLLVMAGAAGCGPAGPRPDAAGANADTAGTTAQKAPARYAADDLDKVECLRQRTVYFDFDRAEIKAEAQAILKCHGRYLGGNPKARATIEGHADERGTREYSLALSERRGDAVADALRSNDALAEQLSVAAFGEERPVCTEYEESCWSRNRRVEIVYTAR